MKEDWSYHKTAETLVIAAAECNQVFQADCIVLRDYLEQHNGVYPTVPELVGKAVVGSPPDIGRGYYDECTSSAEIERAIEGAYGHLRLDQYQADWTFEYGVPPNPIFVDNTAPQTWTVKDSQGSEWDCNNGDKSHNQTVHEQGTARFPFKTIRKAIMRAMGITRNTPGGDPRRAGYGWTLLVRPGVYPENVSITLPLTLRKDPRYPGEVVIGRP